MNNVTIFKDIKTTSAGFVKPVEVIFDRIKNGKSKELVEQIRHEPDRDKRNELKKKLPSICFSGEFKTRSALGLVKHSGYICLDFDKLEDKSLLREQLSKDSYTFALFESPSGQGLKVVVKILPDVATHKQQFEALMDYYSHPNFDKATSDVSRVCFESYDPDIYVNPNSQVFDLINEVDYDELGDDTYIPETSSLIKIQNLEKWWTTKYSVHKGERNNNLIKLAFAFNDFGIHKKEAESYFMRFIEKDFGVREIETILNSGYKRRENFGIKTFEDYRLKSELQHDIRRGRSVSEMKKTYPTLQNLELVVEKIKEDAPVSEFWSIDKKGKYSLVHSLFKQYLQSNQIFKYYPNETSFVFVKVIENKVRILKEEQIKDFVLDDLYNREGIGMQPYELMAGATRYFKADYLSFLDNINLNIKKDTQDNCYLYYRNCALEVSKDGINKIDYVDLDGYVWENQIVDRDFVQTDYKDGMYRNFVYLVANKENERYKTLKSVLGYLMHSYKTSANNKAIIFNDEVISENPNGGSGKGLIVQGLSRLKKVSILDGKQFDFDKSFMYQTVDIDSQVLVYDDVKKNFNFERLFSAITEGITVERKNKDAMRLRIDESPKVLITTNYTIGGVGGSFERRRFEIELSSYFGSHHTPLDEFGVMLFDEWDSDEWMMFDNFMIECVKYYLKTGLNKTEYKNLHTRKFIKDTSFEFYEFVEDGNVEQNINIYTKTLFDRFIEDYPDYKRWLSNKKFSIWIDHYIKFYELEIERGKDGGGRWFRVINDNSKGIIPF